MSIRYYLFLSILLLPVFSLPTPSPMPKILVLIIASDDYPVYTELQKMWRSYMHYDPTHVQAYFIRGDANLQTPYAIDNDVIWACTAENVIPGIVNKTILALEAFEPQLKKYAFDYVLRTNLSSFYVFPRLLEFLRMCPVKGFYCGSSIGVEGIGSGCGFIMSPDVACMLVENKHELFDDETSFDDVVIGAFLKSKGVPLIPHVRMDFFTPEAWENIRHAIPEEVFHFRVKHSIELRLQYDIHVQSELRTLFYNHLSLKEVL